MPPNDKYARWYDQIIDRAISRKLKGYGENHHILPRSLGGDNSKSNIVKLTCREHFLCHWLLTKIVESPEDKRKTNYAFWCLRMSKSKQHILSGWQYEILRLAHYRSLIGRKTSAVTGRKISAALKGRKRTITPEVEAQRRAKISQTLKGIKRPPRTPEHSARQSEAIRQRHLTDPEYHKRVVENAIRVSKLSPILVKGRKLSPEHRAKLKAKKQEQRAAISARTTEQWAKKRREKLEASKIIKV